MHELSAHRPLLFSIAYRMLGSVAEAEDVVQETFLRFHSAVREGAEIGNPRAYLASIATRLSIDQLRSARTRRETYVGEWLPEPVVEGNEKAPDEKMEMAESLSMAFLLVLEALTPVERAVFLLREVFDYEYAEIAGIVGKSEENCRQLFTRARRHIEAGRPRFEVSQEKREELAHRFFSAVREGSMEGLVHLLATDAVFYGDGGGKAMAVTHPVLGRDRVAKLLAGLGRKGRDVGMQMREVEVNGQPGAMIFDSQHRLLNVMTLDIEGGQVHAVRAVVNPEKLGHLGPLSDLTRIRTAQS